MNITIMKFGGTSVANIERIKNVADIIKNKKEDNNKIVVVVSAMAGVTNDLIEKSKAISKNFQVRNMMYYYPRGNKSLQHFYLLVL